MQAVTDPYTLASPEPKVAVLTDGNVASSGEATAIAFKGRPNTRFFGAATCGLSTANEPFMVDGATLTLTVSTIADRNKVAYGDTLPPDEVIMDNTELLNRAISWIRGG
jgi:C-terminal processing protease CtpA/Prc